MNSLTHGILTVLAVFSVGFVLKLIDSALASLTGLNNLASDLALFMLLLPLAAVALRKVNLRD